jgi:hypothetical protein
MASYCESLRVPLELEVQCIAESNIWWNISQTTVPTQCNSARVRFESTDRIFFKISWIYSQLPFVVRARLGTEAVLKCGLDENEDFIVIDGCVHRLELVRSTICTRLIAQEIVDMMLRLSKSVWNCLFIYNNLSLEAKKVIKTHRDVNKFVEFYPLLFGFGNGNIYLRRSVANRASCKPDRKKYNAIYELLTRIFPDKENSKLVHDHTGSVKYCLNIEWIWKKLPVGESRIFATVDDLYKFLLRHPSITVFENSAHVTSILSEYPCENSVVREVFKIMQNKRSTTDLVVLKALPLWCKTRIRSRNELNKFINMHLQEICNLSRESSQLMQSEQCSSTIHRTDQLLPSLGNCTTSSENLSQASRGETYKYSSNKECMKDFYELAPLDPIDHDDNSTVGILDLDNQ